MRAIYLFTCMLLVATGLGCSSIAPPAPWWTRGSQDDQRRDTARFDPYPDVHSGPSLEGVRPPDFTKPASEFRYIREQTQRVPAGGPPPAF